MQMGFMTRRETFDAISIKEQMLEKHEMARKKLFIVDLEKALASVVREVI